MTITAVTKRFSDYRLGRLDTWLDDEIAKNRLMGATLIINHRGHLIYSQAAGFTDELKTQPTALDTMFWIASMTKPVTSLAALMLAEEGRLIISEPIETYLPEFADVQVLSDETTNKREAPRVKPTVQDLLRHTSGLTYGQFNEGEVATAYGAAKVYDFGSTNAEMSKRLATLPLVHQPGTCFEYGMSTDLLGHLVEVISGQTLQTFVQDKIMTPLGAQDTTFTVEASKRHRVADFPEAMKGMDLIPPYKHSPTWFSGGGGLWSTATDYMRFALMLLDEGRVDNRQLVSPPMIRHMMSNHLPPNIRFGSYTPELGITAPDPSMGQGFGLGLAVRLENGQNPAPGSIGDAFWPGVSGANFWIDPKEELAVVFMAHAAPWRSLHRSALRQLVYQALTE